MIKTFLLSIILKLTTILLMLQGLGAYVTAIYLKIVTFPGVFLIFTYSHTIFTLFTVVIISVIALFNVQFIIAWLYKVFNVTNFIDLIKTILWVFLLTFIYFFLVYIIVVYLYGNSGGGGTAGTILYHFTNPETGAANLEKYIEENDFTKEEIKDIIDIQLDTYKDFNVKRCKTFVMILWGTGIIVTLARTLVTYSITNALH